jgi:large subunit ribosomal protein L15
MKLSNLPKIKAKSKKRLGRGYGSGKGGHTSGRGQKGQKSRSKIPIWFEGGQLPLIRRTPFIKGKGRFKSIKPQPITVNLTRLNQFKANSLVDLKSAIKTLKLHPKRVEKHGLKIIASGKLDKPLKVNLPHSKGAEKAIKAQKGEIVSK